MRNNLESSLPANEMPENSGNEADMSKIYIPSTNVVDLESRWPTKFHQRFIKRFFDIAVSLALLSVVLPLMIVVALLVKITSKGPIIYKQKRLTIGGKYFIIYKFRTMATNAEKSTGAKMADVGDVRITKLGKFLRKSRIDELPQLLNIVIGDMSLIGPRPERAEIAYELSQHLPNIHHRIDVKAGLTGLAQIELGYVSTAETYKEKLNWDIYYIENYSLWLDLKIVIGTIKVILTGFGAR